MKSTVGLEKYVEAFRDGSASLINRDMVIDGSITTEAKTAMVVAGTIRGAVKTGGDLVILEGGTVEGGAQCERLIVAGGMACGATNQAEIACSILHVLSTGRLEGDDMTVRYDLMRMDPGAQIRARLMPSGKKVDSSVLEPSTAPAAGLPPALRAVSDHEPALPGAAPAQGSGSGAAAPLVRSIPPAMQPGATSRTETFAQAHGMTAQSGAARAAVGSAA